MTNTSDAVVNTTVTDDLSDVLDNAAIGTIGTGGVLDGTTLTWTIANLAPDAVTTLSYTVTVDADAFNQTLGNVATPGPGGECLTDCDTEHPTPGYTLTKTSDPADGATVEPGDTVTYTLTVTNTSDAVVNTTVTDDLSDVLDNAAIGTIGTGGVLDGTTLTWTIANLAPDAVTTLSYTVTVDADAFNETLGNVATPGPGGQCLTDCDTEHPTPGYTLTKTSDPADGATVSR